MSELLAWTSVRTTSSKIPTIDDTNESDRLLEIGIFVTDQLDPWKFRGAVNQALTPWPDLEEVVERCDEEAREMHRENGLFQLMEMNVTSEIDQIQHEIQDLLGRYGEPGDFIMAGRGSSMIERPMIEEWLPEVFHWFHPDVVVDLAVISYTMALAGRTVLEPHYEFEGKRAMDEAQRSFLEFRHYTEVFKAVPLKEEGSEDEE